MGTSKADGKRSLKEMEEEEDLYQEDDEETEDELLGYGQVDETKRGKKEVNMSSGGDAGSGRWSSSPAVTCQVDRCTTDMTYAKKYHVRHKVCEFHAKSPSTLVSGTYQRFCQQCSRFHALSEFDNNKRSCRRRLAGHNERRRKSSTDYHGETSI